MKYQTIFLDFDGVLVDSMNIKTEAFVSFFTEYGEEVVKKVIDYHIKNGSTSRQEKFKYFYKNFLNKELSKQQLDVLCSEFSTITLDKTISAPYILGAQEFLESNYKKYPLFIVSGIPQKELELIIKRRNMEKYFKAVCGSPPDKFVIMANILSRNYYNPPQTIYIGDTLGDWEYSQNLGIDFLGISKDPTTFPSDVPTIKDFKERIDGL